MIVEQLERHRDACRLCCGVAVCAESARLLALRVPAAPRIEMIDLAAHKETCLKCRDHALCHIGRGIVKAAGEALLDAGRRPVPA